MENLFGLKNFGDTCYFNASLQLLLTNKDFVENVKNQKKSEFRTAFLNVITRNGKGNSLEMFWSFLKKNGIYAEKQQSDAFKFLLSLFFYFRKNDIDNSPYKSIYSDKHGKKTNIFSHTLNFLDGKNFDESIKKILLSFEIGQKLIKLSRNILIRINRSTNTFLKKIPTIPLTLKLKEGLVYEAIGFMIHRGNSLRSGHYTALVKTPKNWWELDDKNISIKSEEFVKNEISKFKKSRCMAIQYKRVYRNDKLQKLKTQNEELKRQNEELKRQKSYLTIGSNKDNRKLIELGSQVERLKKRILELREQLKERRNIESLNKLTIQTKRNYEITKNETLLIYSKVLESINTGDKNEIQRNILKLPKNIAKEVTEIVNHFLPE